MKLKMGDVINYKDSQASMRYGTGVITEITPDEYTILWSGRGLTKYKRSIIDGKLEGVFQRGDKGADLPKERHLHLGASKAGIAFNENYDRARIVGLCERLKESGARGAKAVADGLEAELLTKKFALRGTAKAVLLQLAQLCGGHTSACEDARLISRELFFGYVLQKSDFDSL